MPQTARVQLNNPKLLTWARENAGYTVEELADRLGKDPGDICQWESGQKAPTYRQLQKLAECVGRPVAALFLPEPAEEPGPPDDYRLLEDEAQRQFAPEALRAFRELRNSLVDLGELGNEMGSPITLNIPECRLSGDPEDCSSSLRTTLGISMDGQLSWTSPYNAMDRWRQVLFERGVLVRIFNVPVEQFRGFSIIERGIGGIGISSSDAPVARIFSLFHEVAHLCLRRPGVSGELDVARSRDASDAATVERYCNRFAGSFLLPADEQRVHRELQSVAQDFTLESAQKCARKFNVSKYVIALRLLHLDMVSEEACWQQWLDWQEEDRRAPDRGTGQADFYSVKLSRFGKPFASTVLDAMDQGALTPVAAARMLTVKPDQLQKIRHRLVG